MARIIPVGFGEAAFIFTAGIGTPDFVTTLGVSLIGIAPEDRPAAADALFAAWRDNMLPLQGVEVTLDRVELAVGLAGGVSGSVRSVNPPQAGSQSGTAMPVAAAAIVNKLTAELGRRGRGRSFIPGSLTDADVFSAGQIDVPKAAALSSAYNDMLVEIATAPVGMATAPVLLHSDGGTPTPITGAATSPLMGWIRGRIR